MHVIKRFRGEHNGNRYTTYTFNTGHEFRQWDSGGYYGYTPKGNYASVPTTQKMIRIASEYEDNRVQVPA